MKSISVILTVFFCATAFANNTTVTVDKIGSGGYSASYYKNTNYVSPEIHVIGIYQSRSSQDYSHTVGTAVVNITGTNNIPVSLVLSAYAPTHWILQGNGISFVNSVLINGYYPGAVSGIDGNRVVNKTWDNYLGAFVIAWPADSREPDRAKLVKHVENMYGAPISTFSGAYEASQFTITLTPAPEPEKDIRLFTGLGLLGLGLLGLLIFWAWKRRAD